MDKHKKGFKISLITCLFLLAALGVANFFAIRQQIWRSALAQVRASVAGDITTIAGGGASDGGLATDAQLWQPAQVATDTAGNVYIADTNQHRVRKVNASSNIITTIAGTGVAGFSGDSGLATAAKLDGPNGVVLDSWQYFYWATCSHRRIDAGTGILHGRWWASFSFGGDGQPPALHYFGAALSLQQ